MTDMNKKPQETLDELLERLGYPPTVDMEPGVAEVVIGTPPMAPPGWKPNSPSSSDG